MLVNASCKPSLGEPGRANKMLQAENGQKVDKFESIYLFPIVTDIDEKWTLVFEHAINHLSFGYFRLPQLKSYFSCFGIFFRTFFVCFLFSSRAIHF